MVRKLRNRVILEDSVVGESSSINEPPKKIPRLRKGLADGIEPELVDTFTDEDGFTRYHFNKTCWISYHPNYMISNHPCQRQREPLCGTAQAVANGLIPGNKRGRPAEPVVEWAANIVVDLKGYVLGLKAGAQLGPRTLYAEPLSRFNDSHWVESNLGHSCVVLGQNDTLMAIPDEIRPPDNHVMIAVVELSGIRGCIYRMAPPVTQEESVRDQGIPNRADGDNSQEDLTNQSIPGNPADAKEDNGQDGDQEENSDSFADQTDKDRETSAQIFLRNLGLNIANTSTPLENGHQQRQPMGILVNSGADGDAGISPAIHSTVRRSIKVGNPVARRLFHNEIEEDDLRLINNTIPWGTSQQSDQADGDDNQQSIQQSSKNSFEIDEETNRMSCDMEL